jgi:enterochelin esterase family protein
MEYLFEVADRHGVRTTIPDPSNPLRAGGAFGDKSVLEFAGYESPHWVTEEPVPHVEAGAEVAAPLLDAAVPVLLWSPDGLGEGEPAPLLLVHDGPEFDRLGGFTQYLGAAIAAGALPPLRAALLGPTERDAWYSANPAYAQTLEDAVLPALDTLAPASTRIGVGVSLGALAMLHLHRSAPDLLDGLFLQSGSFFTPRLDPQEARFSGFATVTSFIADVHAAVEDPRPVPTVLTCGTVEENLENNRATADALHRLGYGGRLVTVHDAHNYTAWRDALDPHLTGLITEVVCARAA